MRSAQIGKFRVTCADGLEPREIGRGTAARYVVEVENCTKHLPYDVRVSAMQRDHWLHFRSTSPTSWATELLSIPARADRKDECDLVHNNYRSVRLEQVIQCESFAYRKTGLSRYTDDYRGLPIEVNVYVAP